MSSPEQNRPIRVNVIDFRGRGSDNPEAETRDLQIETIRFAMRELFNKLLQIFNRQVNEENTTKLSKKLIKQIVDSLSEWLKTRYGENSTIQGLDILRKTTSIELSPESGLKLETSFWICGKKIHFVFNIEGDLKKTNAATPEDEQKEMSKQLLTPTRRIIISNQLRNHLTGLNLLNDPLAIVYILSNNQLIRLNNFYSGFIPLNLLKIVQCPTKGNGIEYHVAINGYIIMKGDKSQINGVMPIFDQTGQISHLNQKSWTREGLDLKGGIILNAPSRI